MSGVIRVVVVDDHPLFREGIAATLKRERTIRFVGQGAKALDAVTLGLSLRPDVLLLDVGVPGDVLAAVREIGRGCPGVNVMMMRATERDANVSIVLQAGARGYIVKNISARDLIVAVLAIAAGETYVAPALADRALSEMRQLLTTVPTKGNEVPLTRREDDTINLVAEGLTNKEIAKRLGITEKTVKHYMTSIMDKLHVRNRVEAALAARNRMTDERPALG